MESTNIGCPCLVLDIPCQPHCTCRTPGMSHGCRNCATYGSLEQRKRMAEYLNNARLEYDKTLATKPLDDFANWFFGVFEEITEIESNSETIDYLTSYIDGDGSFVIEFSVDCNRAGIHRDNKVTITKDKVVKIRLAEIIESGSIPSKLKEAIEKKLKE